MEKIKLGLFDIFGFIFPGLLALFAVTLPFIWNIAPADLLKFFEEAKGIPITLLILFGSYIIGASIHQIGYYWYYLMAMIIYYWGLRLLLYIISLFYKKDKKEVIESKIEALKEKHALLNSLRDITENYILVRQFTPAHILSLEEWTSKRAMSFNLSLSFLILIFTSTYVRKRTDNVIWLIIEIFSILSSVSLLIRAYGYDFWWKKELKLIVDTFDLKGKKLDQNTSAGAGITKTSP